MKELSDLEVGGGAQAKRRAVGVELEANISNATQARPLTELAQPCLRTVLWLLPSQDGYDIGLHRDLGVGEGDDRCRSTLGSQEEKHH